MTFPPNRPWSPVLATVKGNQVFPKPRVALRGRRRFWIFVDLGGRHTVTLWAPSGPPSSITQNGAAQHSNYPRTLLDMFCWCGERIAHVILCLTASP